MTTADRTSLEQERDFLLASLRRLEDELASGQLTEDEYEQLRDQQTIRAAALLRELDDDASVKQAGNDDIRIVEGDVVLKAPKKTLSQKALFTGVGVIAFLALAGGLLFGALNDRGSGEVGTGAVAANSNTLLAKAQDQTAKGHPADAVKTYDAVLKADPNNPEALTYRGWLVRLAGLPNEGLKSIEQAIATDPSYPDAHFFKGFILFRDRQDPKSAIPEFQTFLADNPPSEMVPLVTQALQDAQAQAAQAK